MKEQGVPFFYNAQDLGKSFRAVSVDFIKTESHDIVNHWYHSAKDADLFVWMDSESNIIKQQLSFYGQVIEWNVVEGLKTGCLLENDNLEGKQRGSEIIKFDPLPQKSCLAQAVDLLHHIEVLKQNDRQLLIENFVSTDRTLSKMNPEEFVKKFGKVLEKRPQARKSWWGRFAKWFKQNLD